MYSAPPSGADSGTINPAALNSTDPLNSAPRGVKRIRSPDHNQGVAISGNSGDANPRKRAQHAVATNTGFISAPSGQPNMSGVPSALPPPQTPQNPSAPLSGQGVAYAQPPQTSPPPKTTPTKTQTLKALPTVRDHTTDQLNAANDEYLPREVDEFGEKKVTANGTLLGGRHYRVRTFLVPNRGDKLFMLATECARVLGYRDSYLLFNKNRSLFKIIASQAEKDDLVQQEILPFSYRSRQIAIVTARSMFRQFGSRVIENGRRVRDDYWENKARKQGFTEADLAGEKRPGQARAREAAEAQSQVLLGAPQGEIVYSNAPAQFPGGPPQPQLVQPDIGDNRPRDYGVNFKSGPRQEITGPPYQDQTRPAPVGEVNAQAHHAAEYNRQVNQSREIRHDWNQTAWRRPHEQPQSTLSQTIGSSDPSVPTSRAAAQSPHTTAGSMAQPSLVPSQSPQMMMTNPPYSQPIHAQNPISQAPMRGSVTAGTLPQATQSYHYPGASGQMWPQTTQNPQHGYSGYTTQSQHGHPSQSPAPQLRHSSSGVQPGMQFSGMPGIGQNYGSSQGMYSADQTPRGYMPQPAPGGSSQGQQSWSGQQSPANQWWANQPQ